MNRVEGCKQGSVWARCISIFCALAFGVMLGGGVASADMSVVVNASVLSAPDPNLSIVDIQGPSPQRVTGTKTVFLADGDYLLYGGGLYGGFTVTGNVLSNFTGSVISAAPGEISFDLTRLTRVTLPFSILDEGENDMVFTISYHSNLVRNGDQTIYLPDGQYGVSTRAGHLYGQLSIGSGGVSATGYLLSDGVDVTFDLASLARVTITRGDQLSSVPRGTLPAINGVGGGNRIRLGSYSAYLPPGSYTVGTRYLGYPYGVITVDQGGLASASGYLVEESPGSFAFDLVNLPKVTLNFQELTGPNRAFRPTVYEMFGTADQGWILLPPDSSYFIHAQSSATRYGEFSLDAAGRVVDATGVLLVNGNTISFDLCQTNALEVTPPAGRAFYLHSHYSVLEPSVLYLPNGDYSINTYDVDRRVVTGEIRFGLSPAGIVVTSFSGEGSQMGLSLQPSPCIPPDADEDGVLDDMDACPDTPAGMQVDGSGCSAWQNIESQCDSWLAKSHGKYMSCVAHVVNSLAGEGLIDETEKGEYISAAARQK